MFSWIFMLLGLLLWVASVGWAVLKEEEKLVTGEDFNFSPTNLGFVAPYYVLRDLFSNIAEFIITGVKLLFSQEFRNEFLESGIEEE